MVAASRSSIVGALLRIAVPENRHLVVDFLRGLSRDELECVAEFEGACSIEASQNTRLNRYRLLAPFFDPSSSERWNNTDDCAHKTFVLLTWLEFRSVTQNSRVSTNSAKSL